MCMTREAWGRRMLRAGGGPPKKPAHHFMVGVKGCARSLYPQPQVPDVMLKLGFLIPSAEFLHSARLPCGYRAHTAQLRRRLKVFQ